MISKYYTPVDGTYEKFNYAMMGGTYGKFVIVAFWPDSIKYDRVLNSWYPSCLMSDRVPLGRIMVDEVYQGNGEARHGTGKYIFYAKMATKGCMPEFFEDINNR